jgi:hypothetical protein
MTVGNLVLELLREKSRKDNILAITHSLLPPLHCQKTFSEEPSLMAS